MAIANIGAKQPTQRNSYYDRGCAVCNALDSLPVTEAAALRALLADPAWRYQAIADELAVDPDTPLVIDAYTLSRHARGRCARREKLRG